MSLLVALGARGNLHAAAADNHMSAPAASKMLKDIEALFGVPLFDRLPRGLRPTVYGQTLISHVRMALTNLENGQKTLAALKAGVAGQVRVGIIVTAALTLIPRAIKRVKNAAPKLSIGIEVGTSQDLLASLRRDELDFMIARIPDEESAADFVYEDLSEEVECVVARAGHPLLARPHLRLEDLRDAGWILTSRGSVLRSRVDMMFRDEGLEPPSDVIETTAISLILSLLQDTDYLHVIPVELAKYYATTGSLAILPIDIPCKMANFGIITRRDTVLTPGAQLLLRHIRDVSDALYPKHGD
jgi:DNA-binding transcriptional LysR family regulator